MIIIDNQQDLDKFFNDLTFNVSEINIIKDVKFLFYKDKKSAPGYITKEHFTNITNNIKALEILMFENCVFRNVIFKEINKVGKLLFRNCDINAGFYSCDFVDMLGFSKCNIHTENRSFYKLFGKYYSLSFVDNSAEFLLFDNCTYVNNLYIRGGTIGNLKINDNNNWDKEKRRSYFICPYSISDVKIHNLILEDEEFYKSIYMYFIRYIESVVIESPGDLYKNYKIHKFKIPFLDNVNQYSKVKDVWTFDFWKDKDPVMLSNCVRKISSDINVIYDELLNEVTIIRDSAGFSYTKDLEGFGKMLCMKNPIDIKDLDLKLSNGCSVKELDDYIESKNKQFHYLLTFCILRSSDPEYILWNRDEKYRELRNKKLAAFLEYDKFKKYIMEREKSKEREIDEPYNGDDFYYSWDESGEEYGLNNELATDYNLSEKELEKNTLLINTYNIAKQEFKDYCDKNEFRTKYKYCYIDYIKPKLLLVYEYINRIKRR